MSFSVSIFISAMLRLGVGGVAGSFSFSLLSFSLFSFSLFVLGVEEIGGGVGGDTDGGAEEAEEDEGAGRI